MANQLDLRAGYSYHCPYDRCVRCGDDSCTQTVSSSSPSSMKTGEYCAVEYEYYTITISTQYCCFCRQLYEEYSILDERIEQCHVPRL
jgi:hypothetical protein